MSSGKLNKKSLYQEGGAISKDSINPVVDELSQMVKSRIESGESPEQILYVLIKEQISADQLALAFESVGYNPSDFADLMQTVQATLDQEVMQEQQAMQNQNPVNQELVQQLDMAGEQYGEPQQPMMADGGFTDFWRSPNQLHAPGVPMMMYPKSNLGHLANFASVAIDGINAGRDLRANKNKIQEDYRKNINKINAEGFDYLVDYKGLNPEDYATTAENLYNASNPETKFYIPGSRSLNKLGNKLGFQVPTTIDINNNNTPTPLPTMEAYKEGIRQNFLDNSTVSFDSKSNKYNVIYGTDDKYRSTLTEEQKLRNPTLSAFLERAKNLSKDELEILRSRGLYPKGMGLRADKSSGALVDESDYRTDQDLALMNIPFNQNVTWNPTFNAITQPADFNAPPQRSMLEVDNSTQGGPRARPSYKEWYSKNAINLQGKSEMELMDMYNNTEFKRGGSVLPRFQNLGETRGSLESGVPYNGGGSGMGSLYFEDLAIQDLQNELGTPCDCGDGSFSVDCCDDIATVTETQQESPEVTRGDSVGNFISRGINKAENFIKNNYTMKRIGNAANNAVNLAAVANQFGRDRKAKEAYRENRYFGSIADNVYMPVENPMNKRGTFDLNTGLAEPDNLVDYYAQAMYGKEMYKSGGQFDLPKAQNGLTDFLNTVNSSLGGSDDYWSGGWLDGKEGLVPDELTFNKPTKRQLQTAGALLSSPKNWQAGPSPLQAMLKVADVPGGDLLYNMIDPFGISQYSHLPNYNQYNTKDEAFAAARNDLGRGASFMYGDTRYTTNYEGEAPNNETQTVLDYVTQGLSPEEKERLMEVYKKAGQPPISFEKDTDKYSLPIYGSSSWVDVASGSDVRRPHVNLLGRDNPVYINKRATVPQTRNLLLDELSHNMQIRNDGTGASLWRFGTDAAAGELFGYDPYHREGAFEHEAHERIQPLLREYINQGGTFPDLGFANGGEFEPHMMYDPETGKGYKAKVPADHERMAKMGYTHELPKAMFGMPKLGLPGMNLMNWIPTGAGGNINKSIERVKEDPLSFSRLMSGDMSQAGKFIRFSEYGGELEVDNDTLAALIAAGADIEML